MSKHIAILRRAFASFTKRQRANVRKHLANGVEPLCGEEACLYARPGGL